MDPRSVTGAATALAERAPQGPVPSARRARTREEPQRSPLFAHLSLEELRDFRRTLNGEEAQVSYWRRIIQARLDVVRAGTLGSTDGIKLRPLLTDARVRRSRNAVLDVVPIDDVPPLPSLAELWDRRVEPGDEAGQRALEADLSEAETQLSAYRRALHERIDDATSELIARYRETPSLCLSVLPLGPERRAR